MNTTYLKYEIVRRLRNRQSYIASLLFPVGLFWLFGATNKHDLNFDRGLNGAAFYMIGMITFGATAAVVSSGALIAVERQIGWNRQLRLSPLSPKASIAIKVLIGYLIAGITILLLYVAGISQGVRLSPVDWVEMTVLILIALIPFALIGVWIGHQFSADAMGPMMGIALAVFAIFGGSYFPVTGNIIGDIGSWIPSYWLNQAGRVGLGGDVWSAKGWLVIAAWTLVAGTLAIRAFQRDTKRG
jgi:ABC-2 type transport system permease protein